MIGDFKKIWDFWAPRYDRLLTQRFVMIPTNETVCAHLKEKAPPPESILDIGCGTGQLALHLAALFPGAEITGADYCRKMIEMAEQKNHFPRLTFIHGSLEQLPPGKRYDVIVSTHSFPYFADKAKTAGTFFRLLKPGGRVIIVQGNNNNAYDALWLFFVHLTVSRGKFLSVGKVNELLLQAGFSPGRVRRIKPTFWMPSVYMVEGLRNQEQIKCDQIQDP